MDDRGTIEARTYPAFEDRAHPMAHIVFEWLPVETARPLVYGEPVTFERNWYQVPRVGDMVRLDDDARGTVRTVEWQPDGRTVKVLVS